MAQNRRWTATLNNYTEDEYQEMELTIRELHAESKLRYAVYGKEVGESGTPHIQAYFAFTTKHQLGGVKRALNNKRWHLDVSKGTEKENAQYIIGPYTKGDKTKPFNPEAVEVGEQEQDAVTYGRKGGAQQQENWRLMRSLAAEGDFDKLAELFPCEATLHHHHFRRLRNEAIARSIKPLDEDKSRHHVNIWLWGETGVGKSFWAEMGTFLHVTSEMKRYRKMPNKWFDDYNYEPIIVIQDLSASEHTKNFVLYKQLGDCWPFKVEVKNSTADIRPQIVIITSNEPLEKVFKDAGEAHLPALLDRFTQWKVERRAKEGEGFSDVARIWHAPTRVPTTEWKHGWYAVDISRTV